MDNLVIISSIINKIDKIERTNKNDALWAKLNKKHYYFTHSLKLGKLIICSQCQ